MHSIVTIERIEMPVVNYRNNAVISLSMIDAVHKRVPGAAKVNFCENRQRFIEGEDFFTVSARDVREHALEDAFPISINEGILLTESGYLMLVKNFNDDLAWKVQRQLVKTYFKAPVAPKLDEEQAQAVAEVLKDPTNLRRLLLGYAEKVLALEQIISDQKFKVEFYDEFGTCKQGQSVQEVAKIMGIGQNRLFNFLKSQRLLLATNMPYQEYVDSDHFKVVIKMRRDPDLNEMVPYRQTMITPKGFHLIINKIKESENKLEAPEKALNDVNVNLLGDGHLEKKGKSKKTLIHGVRSIVHKPSHQKPIQNSLDRPESLPKSTMPSPIPALLAKMSEENKNKRRLKL